MITSPLTITLSPAAPNPGSTSYRIVIGPDCGTALAEFLATHTFSRILAVVDEAVAPFWSALSAELPTNLRLPDSAPFHTTSFWRGGESHKGIDGVSELWELFLSHGLDRKSVVLSVGGGAQGDLVGFAAATFKRGLSVIQIPTTLLSQVDASVGGKTGCNFGGVKNLVGVIHHPALVVIDSRSLATLPARDRASGMAEVLKHGAIRDAAYFERWGARPFSELSEIERVSLIEGSIRIKAAIAAADPFERGERKLLNFGHTIGHAIEALSLSETAPMTHGEAIAVGMVAEAHLSVAAGILDIAEVARLEAALRRQNLPTRIPFSTSIEALRLKIADDKKNVGKEVRWTLLERLGSAVFDQTVSEELVESSIKAVLGTE